MLVINHFVSLKTLCPKSLPDRKGILLVVPHSPPHPSPNPTYLLQICGERWSIQIGQITTTSFFFLRVLYKHYKILGFAYRTGLACEFHSSLFHLAC